MEFAGFQLGNGTIKPIEKHITAIRDFPEPKNLTDMRSFFALCEQVSYAYTIKDVRQLVLLPAESRYSPRGATSFFPGGGGIVTSPKGASLRGMGYPLPLGRKFLIFVPS